MSEISRVALFGKLNPVAYRAIESATVFCKMRGNPYVELVHWLHQILQLQDSDLHRIVKAIQPRAVTSCGRTLPKRSSDCHAGRHRSPTSQRMSKRRLNAVGCWRR